MKIEKLQGINKNDTSNMILKVFAHGKQISDQTNLLSFKNYLTGKGFQINSHDYNCFFKDLEEAEAGYINKEQPNIFNWRFKLKDVADQIFNPNKRVIISSPLEEVDSPVTPPQPPKKKRGRPFGAKTRIRTVKTKVPTITSLNGSGELLLIFNTSKGETMKLNLTDAKNLISQLEVFKNL